MSEFDPARRRLSRQELEAEIERLQEHKRKQAEDIMTLGQMVGEREAEIERLRAALRAIAVAETLTNEAEILQDIARAALAKAEGR